MAQISNDVIEIILKSLEVPEVSRWRSVSRHYNSLITQDRSFIKAYNDERPSSPWIFMSYFLDYGIGYLDGQRVSDGKRIRVGPFEDFENWEIYGMAGNFVVMSNEYMLGPFVVVNVVTQKIVDSVESPKMYMDGRIIACRVEILLQEDSYKLVCVFLQQREGMLMLLPFHSVYDPSSTCQWEIQGLYMVDKRTREERGNRKYTLIDLNTWKWFTIFYMFSDKGNCVCKVRLENDKILIPMNRPEDEEEEEEEEEDETEDEEEDETEDEEEDEDEDAEELLEEEEEEEDDGLILTWHHFGGYSFCVKAFNFYWYDGSTFESVQQVDIYKRGLRGERYTMIGMVPYHESTRVLNPESFSGWEFDGVFYVSFQTKSIIQEDDISEDDISEDDISEDDISEDDRSEDDIFTIVDRYDIEKKMLLERIRFAHNAKGFEHSRVHFTSRLTLPPPPVRRIIRRTVQVKPVRHPKSEDMEIEECSSLSNE